jgi:hypothetical protein
MADASNCAPLATSLNGVVTPLYFDRQIVRADDLTLDRSSHDAELERMRRLLHGWGIVAGFALLNQEENQDTVTVTPGYGITPNGNEIFLTQAVALSGLSNLLRSACGSNLPGCEVVDEAVHVSAREIWWQGWVQGWLVARPFRKDGELRPGVPEGCAHPANTLLPSRRCEGVTFDIVCNLNYPHLQETQSCEYMTAWMCRSAGQGHEPLPLPPAVEACDDYLVIGYLTSWEGSLNHDYQFRRQLLPVSLLQDWMTACMCGNGSELKVAPDPAPQKQPQPDPVTTPVITEPEPAIDPTRVIPPVLTTIPTKPIDFTPPKAPVVIPTFRKPSWELLNASAIANGLQPVEIEIDHQQKLSLAGIDAPDKLMTADLDAIAFTTGISKLTLEAVRKDVQEKQFLINAPQL